MIIEVLDNAAEAQAFTDMAIHKGYRKVDRITLEDGSVMAIAYTD